MRTAVHGMPRIGGRRELKWALEDYWAGRITEGRLSEVAAGIRSDNWRSLAAAGVGFVPSNDFSLYDHVLDAAVALGAFPARLGPPAAHAGLMRHFAMAGGGDVDGVAVAPLELTKWFDTNYHQLVPEIGPDTLLSPDPSKALGELDEATALGIETTPALLGPLTFLLRGTTDIPGFSPLTLLDRLVEVYLELLEALVAAGADWVRLDEPALAEDRSLVELDAMAQAYRRLGEASSRPRLAISTYFGHVGEAMATLVDLPVEGIGLDFCRGMGNLELIEATGGLGQRVLFAGVIDGRNVWVNDLDASLRLLELVGMHASEVVASTSCSLLHVLVSLGADATIDPEVRPWLAFAEEKVRELAVLAKGAEHGPGSIAGELEANRAVRAAAARPGGFRTLAFAWRWQRLPAILVGSARRPIAPPRRLRASPCPPFPPRRSARSPRPLRSGPCGLRGVPARRQGRSTAGCWKPRSTASSPSRRSSVSTCSSTASPSATTWSVTSPLPSAVSCCPTPAGSSPTDPVACAPRSSSVTSPGPSRSPSPGPSTRSPAPAGP